MDRRLAIVSQGWSDYMGGDGQGRGSSQVAIAFVLLAVTSALWAGNSVIGRALRDDVGPFVLSFWRWVLTFAGAGALVGRELWVKRAQIRPLLPYLALVALVGTAPNNAVSFWALRQTTAINMQLFNSTIPLWVMLISWVAFRARPGRLEGVGLLVSLAGVLVIVAAGDLQRLLSLSINQGDLVILASFAVWSLYVVLLQFRPSAFSLPAFIALVAGMGAFEALPLAWIESRSSAQPFLPLEWPVIGGALYLGLVASLIANAAHYHAVSVVGPARSALFIHLVPVFGAVLSAFFLGEHLQSFHAAGFALVLAGLWLANRGRTVVPVR